LLPQWLPQPQPQPQQPPVPLGQRALAEPNLAALAQVVAQAKVVHWRRLTQLTRNTSFVAVVVLTAGSYGAAAL
jgi:hypothetical protein